MRVTVRSRTVAGTDGTTTRVIRTMTRGGPVARGPLRNRLTDW